MSRHALRTAFAAALALPFCTAPFASAQEADAKAAESKTSDEPTVPPHLDLEKLFPKDGLFGPSARGAEFSHGARFAAWLWKPYGERRHGNDLWLLDVSTGDVRRVTSAPAMAEHLANAREVLADRKARFKKTKKGTDEDDTETDDTAKSDDAQKKKTKKKSDQGKGGKHGDKKDKKHDDDAKTKVEHEQWLTDDDAKQKKAPRWSGVSSFTWSPDSDELLFVSGGDVFRLVPSKQEGGPDAVTRLTRTRSRESSVDYLPDGSGFTFLRDDALFRVRWNDHLVEQIDPQFPRSEQLVGYELSPDGNRAVLLTRERSSSSNGSGRTVKIARYTDRFMDVREVPRRVSDDPIDTAKTHVYLYDLFGSLAEQGVLWRVHSRDSTGPRDVLRTPNWSEDSARVTFAEFEQKSSHLVIFESEFPDNDAAKAARKKAAESSAKGGETSDGDSKKDRVADAIVVDRPARAVYEFHHFGGPNTPRMIEPEYVHDDRRIVFLSEQSGYRHLHVVDPIYQSVEQLTRGRYEVYPIGMSEDRRTMFVTATKEHPSQQDLYAVDVDSGEMKRLSGKVGQYSSATMSADGRYALATFVAYGSLRELVLLDTKRHGKQKVLTESHPESTDLVTKAVPEFFEFDNRNGQRIHGFLFKPEGWSAEVKRPLLIYVYGGPLGTRKQVTQGNFHSDGYLFQGYMAAKHGYLTCTIDPRGMSGYGALYEKSNFEQVGRPQVEDLVDSVNFLVESFGADPERVGIHGWSFGGFQTQMCLYTEPDVFHVGIAGAGPTEWENYNSWYSTGTIGPSRVGKTDLKKFSLLPLAKNLKGKLLLVHGMEDSNVLYQDTVRVYRELLKAGKETNVDLFLDPTGGHSLGGDVERVARARKYEAYLLRTLGEGARTEVSVAAEEAEATDDGDADVASCKSGTER